MRVEKNQRWKGILAAVLAVLLLLCSYMTILPGRLFLPWLDFEVCAVQPEQNALRAGSAAVVRRGVIVDSGMLAVWTDGSGHFRAGRVQNVQNGQAVMEGDGVQLPVQEIYGVAKYEIFGLGAVLDVLSRQPGRNLVWAADALYVFAWCVWGLTLPQRQRRRRRENLIKLFEQYGKQYDLEDEGVDY